MTFVQVIAVRQKVRLQTAFSCSVSHYFSFTLFLYVVKEIDLLCGHLRQEALLLNPYAAKQKNVGLKRTGPSRVKS